MSRKYSSGLIALVVPTKGRPQYVLTLLESICDQTEKPGVIVIIDSGGESKSVVESFSDKLEIDYVNSNLTGQIPQRNEGIGRVIDKYKLVGFIDDDIVLENEAISAMIQMWNNSEDSVAAISFNITNLPHPRTSFFERFILNGSKTEGDVLSSGYNVGFCPASENKQIRWTNGGSTVWRTSVIREFEQDQINSRWAACEDLIYSYPIGKKYKFFVCAAARVRDTGKTTQPNIGKSFYQGRGITLWRYYFVASNKEMKISSFFWMIFNQVLIRIVSGVATLNLRKMSYALGQLTAIFWVIIDLIKVRPIKNIIDERN